MTRSKTKTFLISFLLAAVAVCLSVALVACGKKDDDKKSANYGAGEEGVYYYDKDASTEYLMTLQSGTYMISADGTKGYSGTYSYDEDEKTVSFTAEDGEDFSAAFTDDVMQLAIAGTDYTFLKKVDYSVKFMDGNSTVGTQAVTYGKSASKIDAGKDGYIFIGWYEDAAFTTQYKFNTAVTGDVTLYAYYIAIDSSIPNFEVQFVSGGDVIYTTTTQNGIVLDFPETEVDGWWVSATNSADELTYKYDGETLTEAAKLFAVKGAKLGASVYGDRITWETSVSSATITVDGTVITSNATGTSYMYGFDSLSTGRHEISITGSGYTENLVYVVNGLSRVSNFAVYGTTLVYNAVEGAQYYCVSVECGNPSHSHDMVYNGSSVTYDFSNCEMGKDGIKFTVYAYGTGYMESVSETFVYALILDAAKVTVSESTDTASWNAVANATGYEIYIGGEYAETVIDTTYSFKYEEQGKTIEIAVKPVAPGYYSEISDAAKYTKTTLKTPEITGVSDYGFTWDEVKGAGQYELSINGYIVIIDKNADGDLPTEYALSSSDMDHVFDTNVITITAIGDKNSQESDLLYVTDKTMSPAISYKDGTVTWNYALAATTYYVDVDGDVSVVSGVNSFDVTFTHSGENVITVYFDADDSAAGVATINITTYAIVFDTRGGENMDTIYVASGDTINLEEPVYALGHADFGGWYTLPDLTADENALHYAGDGVEFVSGTTFDGNSTLVLYAYWSAQRIEVTLDTGLYGTFSDGDTMQETEVAYGSSSFTLPTPELVTDSTKVFLGWYTEANGQGTQYTDENGKAVVKYSNIYVNELYAAWGTAINLELTRYSGSDVLEVSAGADIDKVPNGEVTVPSSYVVNGKEYTVAVINSGAFSGSSKLVKVNIPDTIQYIGTTNNGYAAGSGAFAQCSSLQGVYVYATGEEQNTKEVTYYSDDSGLLYKKTGSSDSAGVELIFYPHAKTSASVTIPETVSNEYEYEYEGNNLVKVTRTVTGFASQVFASNETLETITIPATISTISSQTFSQCAALTSVIFSDTVYDADAVAASSLTVEVKAFEKCTALTSVTLPSRLSSFDPECFSGCTALSSVSIVSGGTFSSSDGMLLKGATTIVYCPEGRSGEVTIRTGITTIGEKAFQSCKLITKITLSSSVTLIEEEAFSNCTGLTEIDFGDDDESNDLTIKSQAFLSCSGLVEVYLPTRLTHMEEAAFAKTNKLVTVHYDSRAGATTGDLSGLEEYAFSSTASSSGTRTSYVKTLYLGANVPEIQFANIFGGSKLETVIIDEANPNYWSDDATGVVFNKNEDKTGMGDTLMYYPVGRSGDYEIPYGVTTIPDNTFASRSYLTAVTIPETVTYIGSMAFYSCSRLATVTFVEAADIETASALVIGEGAFRSCTALTEMVIPERTTEIGDYIFANCESLVSVTLPSTLEKFGTYDAQGNLIEVSNAFDGCSSLGEIIVNEGNEIFTTIGGILYLNKYNETTEEYEASELILAPRQLKSEYAEVVVPLTVSKIWDQAFYYNKTITSFTMEGEAVYGLEIGEEIFYSASNLATVVLPEGLKSIPKNTFRLCTSLTEVVIPYTVTNIGTGAFTSDRALVTVTFEALPEGVQESAYPLTFDDCLDGSGMFQSTSITELVFPDRTTILGKYMCYGLTSLQTLVIGKNTTEIPTRTFSATSNLTSLTFSGGDDSALTKIGDYAFQSSLSKVSGYTLTLPANLKSVGDSAFTYASGVETLVLNDKLETIDDSAFRYMYGLKSVEIPASVTSIGKYAFSDCSAIETLTFAEMSEDAGDVAGSLTFGEHAFSYCSSITEVELPARVTTMNAQVFAFCYDLADITFATDDGYSSLTSIGNYCFWSTPIAEFRFPETKSSITVGSGLFKNCKNLKTVYISSAMTSIGSMFDNCYSIENVEISENNQNFMVDENDGQPILYSKSQGTIVYIYGELSGDVVIADCVTDIGDTAFQGQNTMTSISLPSSVKSIGASAFVGCTYLTAVTFYDGSLPKAEGLTIGNYAFLGCNVLEGFDFGNVTSIGQQAFRYCYLISEVDLSSCTSIGTRAFSECWGITEINLYSAVPGQYSFENCINLETLILGTVTACDNTYTFSGCTSLVTIARSEETLVEGVADLSDFTLSKNYLFTNTGITTLIIGVGTGTSDFASYDFKDCVSLTSVTFTDDVTYIGVQAFVGCTALTEINLNNAKPAQKAFQNCTSLETLILGNVTEFSDTYAFDGCSSLTTIATSEDTLVEGVADLSTFKMSKNYCFSGTGITTVIIGIGTSSSDFASYEFKGCGALTSVTFGDDVTYIGLYAFQDCTSLKEITIPAGVTQLSGSSATSGYTFDGCTALESVIFEGTDSITWIAGYTFRNCTSLKSIDIPWSTTSAVHIGNYAFAGSGIESIEIPKMTGTGSNGIGTYVFDGCASLKTVTFADGYTTFNTYMFRNCTSLETIEIPSGVTTLQNYNFYGCTSLKTVEIPSSVTTISQCCFYGCTSLETIEIPSGVTTIPTQCFYGCTSLKNVSILSTSTVTINDNAFRGCVSLVSIDLSNATLGSSGYQFAECTSLSDVTLSDSLDNIPMYAFGWCTSLTTIIIPDSVTTLNDGAFYGSGLVRIELPESLTDIGPNVFMNCAALEYVDASYAEYIEENAFYNCANLEEIVLGENLEFIGTKAFGGCGALEMITLSESNSEFLVEDGLLYTADYEIVFVTSSVSGTLVLPEGATVSAYAFAGTDVTYVVLPEGTTEIADYAFAESNVVSVEIPEGVISIGVGAFRESAIETLEIPDSVTIISGYAFYMTESLKTVVIGEGVESIGEYAFYGTTIEAIEIPGSVETIGDYAFNSTSSLSEITFNDGLVSIGGYAFTKSAVVNLKLPDTLTSIGEGAFAENDAMETLDMGNGITEIQDNAIKEGIFSYCPSLYSVNFGAVTEIGYGAFRNDTSLEHVDLTGMTRIYHYAFAYTGLVEVTLPAEIGVNSENDFGFRIFEGCENLTTAVFEEGFDGWSSMGSYLFLNCVNLETIVFADSMTQFAGLNGFQGCDSLSQIIISSNITTLGSSSFSGWTEDQTVYLEASYYEATHNLSSLSTSSGWTDFWNNSDAKFCFYMEKPADTSELYDYGLNYWYYDANGNIVEWTVAGLTA